MSVFAPTYILCPVELDFTGPAVLKWASLFAEKYGAQVRILHSYWMEWPRYFTSAQEKEFVGQTEQRIAAISSDIRRMVDGALHPNVSRDIAVLEAPTVQAVFEEMSRTLPDLIVMGSHGRSGLKRARLGSVAETVLYESKAPVFVVKDAGNDSLSPQIRRILAPVNFTALDRESTELAESLASAFNARLYLLHAQERADEDLAPVRQRLCQWVSGDTRSNCDVVEVVRKGNAAEEILLHADEEDVDLIVMGAEHKPFLEITTLGTTSERVIRHSSKPVLVLPWRKR
ncbi:MAG TPA: universal stress protein [Candidatus Acidoferrum sp.]